MEDDNKQHKEFRNTLKNNNNDKCNNDSKKVK